MSSGAAGTAKAVGVIPVPFTGDGSLWHPASLECSVNSVRINCQGGDGATMSGSVQEGSGCGHGTWIWGAHGPAGLMLGLEDLKGPFQPWGLRAQIWAPIATEGMQ